MNKSLEAIIMKLKTSYIQSLLISEMNLLKVRKLSDLHPIHPDFPAQTPGTKHLQAILDPGNVQFFSDELYTQ